MQVYESVNKFLPVQEEEHNENSASTRVCVVASRTATSLCTMEVGKLFRASGRQVFPVKSSLANNLRTLHSYTIKIVFFYNWLQNRSRISTHGVQDGKVHLRKFSRVYHECVRGQIVPCLVLIRVLE